MRSDKGLSLVEMLISMSLFVLVWVSLVGSILVGKEAETRSRHKIQATYAAQRVMESLRKQSFASIVSQTGGSVTVDTKGTDTAADDLIGTQTINVINYPATNPIYKKVGVTIRWREGGPVGPYQMADQVLWTYISSDAQVN